MSKTIFYSFLTKKKFLGGETKQFPYFFQYKSEPLFKVIRSFSAERTRFELVKPFRGLHAFQACLFNHSSTFPVAKAGQR